MNRFLTLAGIALIVATLAACSPGINDGFNHRITFDSNGMVVHALGHPNAHVSRNGDLAIGDKTVTVTPAQRELLQRYYREARTVMDSGAAIGKQGIKMAERGIGAAVESIFHGNDSAATDKQMNAQSAQVDNAASTFCASIETLGATQKAIAASIPAFAPYASGDQMQCTITHSTITVRSSGSPASASTTINFTIK